MSEHRRPSSVPRIDPDKRYIMCSICGWLVPEEEITMEFDGNYVNYKDRKMGTWHLVVCEYCRQSMDDIEKLGERAALMRMGITGNDML